MAQIVEFGCSVGILVYLAHVVDPWAFGVVSFALAITLVITTVGAAPVTRAVITYQFSDRRSLSTAWWASLVPATAVWMAIVLGLVAAGLRGRALVAVLVVGASMPIVGCAGLVQAILQQRLAFRSVAAVRIMAALSASGCALWLGLVGDGFAALLARAIIAPLVIAGLGMVFARWRPRFVIDRATLVKLRSYAPSLAGWGLLNQLQGYGDNLLVGAFLGSTALGYYSMAYRSIEVPVGQVGAASTAVVFPTLSRIRDPDTFRLALLRTQKVLVWVVGPIGVCAMALGDIGVRTILGPRWDQAGLIVQVFGAVALLQAATSQSGVIYLARDAAGLLLRWALIATPVIFGSFAIGLIGGVQGVAWAYLVANVILFYPCWEIPGRLIGLTAPTVLRNLRVELGWGFALAVTMLAVRIRVHIDSRAAVIAVSGALSILYWLGAVVFDSRLREEVGQLMGARLVAIRVPRGQPVSPG